VAQKRGTLGVAGQGANIRRCCGGMLCYRKSSCLRMKVKRCSRFLF